MQSKLKSVKTPWFHVAVGLKQGCLLSSTMFNLYLNDLSEIFRQFGKGIVFENDTISHLTLCRRLSITCRQRTRFAILIGQIINTVYSKQNDYQCK